MWQFLEDMDPKRSPNRVGVRPLLLLFIGAASFLGFAQSPSGSVPKPETPTLLEGQKMLPFNGPSFGSWGNKVCDANGNVYFRTGAFATAPQVIRISPDDSNDQLFELSGDRRKGIELDAFTVSADGHVWMAATDAERAKIFEFAKSGDVLTSTDLRTPDYFLPQEIVVFDSGMMYIAGFFTGLSDPAHRGKTFAGIFTSSGELYKDLRLSEKGFSVNDLQKHPWEGGAALANGAELYVLRPGKILLVSQTGDVRRSMKLEPLAQGQTATRLDYSDGYLSIKLDTMPDPSASGALKNVPNFLVLNASSGKRVGIFRPADSLGTNMLCFSRHEGYTFLTLINKRVYFVFAPVP